MTKGEVKKIPDIAYRVFKAHLQEPKKEEGFVQVRKIPFAPDFQSDHHKQLFLERS